MNKIKYLFKAAFLFFLCLCLTCCGKEDKSESSTIDPYDEYIDESNDNIPQGSTPTVSGSKNGHDYVDLGLSVKWATCNIGAYSPEDYGVYFAWGENITKDYFSYKNYTFTVNDNPVGFHFTKINSISASKYDAASKNWGDLWHIPTTADFKELVEKCKSKWMVYKGVSGRMFTAQNGNSIFFPASGEYDENSISGKNEYGDYWTGDLVISSNTSYTDNQYANAWTYFFTSSKNMNIGEGYRSVGKSIRPVYSVSGGSGGSDDGGNDSSGDAPYVTNFNSSSTKNSITVKFMSSERPKEATIYYGQYFASKALNTTISGKQISAKATGLKSGTKYLFKCTIKTDKGSYTSDVYPAMTN